MKRIIGALVVTCICIALGLSVESSREAGISLAHYPDHSIDEVNAE